MAEKREKIKKELDLLIERGQELHLAMEVECNPEDFLRTFQEKFGEQEGKEAIDKLPDFTREYQSWYSEALACVKQVLPDRVKDFVSYFEYPRVRKNTNYQNYMIRDYLQGLQITRGREVVVDRRAAIPEFKQQVSIVESASAVLDSSLVDLTSILQADLFDSEVDSAWELKKAGHLRAAGAICGVVLEKHLKQMCANRSIVVRKRKPTITDFNDLLKANKAISQAEWRLLQLLADIRNLCCHDREQEPTKEQLDDLLNGTNKVLKQVN